MYFSNALQEATNQTEVSQVLDFRVFGRFIFQIFDFIPILLFLLPVGASCLFRNFLSLSLHFVKQVLCISVPSQPFPLFFPFPFLSTFPTPFSSLPPFLQASSETGNATAAGTAVVATAMAPDGWQPPTFAYEPVQLSLDHSETQGAEAHPPGGPLRPPYRGLRSCSHGGCRAAADRPGSPQRAQS